MPVPRDKRRSAQTSTCRALHANAECLVCTPFVGLAIQLALTKWQERKTCLKR